MCAQSTVIIITLLKAVVGVMNRSGFVCLLLVTC